MYPSLNSDGTLLGAPVPIDYGGYNVEYSGIYLATQRSGTELAPFVDGGFCTNAGTGWAYFRHYLRELDLTTSVIGGNGSIDPAGGTYGVRTVTLTASPDSGYRVKAWSGTDDDSSRSNTNAVTMNLDKMVTVEFEAITANIDGIGIANFDDFAIFAIAWKSTSADGNFNADCDISDPPDDVIDNLDLEVFSFNWLLE